MTKELWLAVLSSSLISGVFGALIAGWFSLRGKRNDYANMYYKLVLKRRLKAYEEIEQLIAMIKIAVIDDDQRPYHLLFSKDDDHETVYKMILGDLSQALWLSQDLYDRTRELNLLVYSHGGDKSGLIEFGKNNYTAIAELRTQIERLHVRDMLTLHDVPRFLKSKNPVDSYSPLPIPN